MKCDTSNCEQLDRAWFIHGPELFHVINDSAECSYTYPRKAETHATNPETEGTCVQEILEVDDLKKIEVSNFHYAEPGPYIKQKWQVQERSSTACVSNYILHDFLALSSLAFPFSVRRRHTSKRHWNIYRVLESILPL